MPSGYTATIGPPPHTPRQGASERFTRVGPKSRSSRWRSSARWLYNARPLRSTEQNPPVQTSTWRLYASISGAGGRVAMICSKVIDPLHQTCMRIAKLLSLAVPVALAAQGPVDLRAPLTMDTTVRTGRLPYGLNYFVRKNSRPEKRAELRLVVNAGSILEDDAQLGLAHFVEHMA